MKKVCIALSLMMFLILSCNKDDKDDDDKTPPQTVSALSATSMNGAVEISWVNPTDEDFLSTKIQYGDVVVEIDKLKNELLVEGLVNGTKYTFNISTLDNDGNISESVAIQSTPDKYVTKVEGAAISSGTFNSIKSTFPVSVVINNYDYKRTMEAGSTQYIWEGAWSIENDTITKFDNNYHTVDFRGDKHVANIIERTNIALLYEYADSTIYVENVFEKTSGDENLLPGTYSYYIKSVSNDVPSYSDDTYYYATITDDGIISYSDSDNNDESSSWNNTDLLNGRFIFVTYKSKTYLIIRDRTLRYLKN